MNSVAQLSAKGQLVIPKAIRDKLGWERGARLEVVETGAGITVRKVVDTQGGLTVAEVLARVQARSPYSGPKITDEDVRRGAREAAWNADQRSLAPDRDAA